MTALPAASSFTAAGVTEGNFKSELSNLIGFLSGLLGTDGVPATALATLGALGSAYVAKTGAYTVVTADRGKTIDATSGSWTLSLPAVSGLSGFSLDVLNSGAGTITIDPNASEQINGATTLSLTSGSAVTLMCNGSAWIASWKSAPTSAAQNLKAPLASPTFTGTPTASAPFGFADGSTAAPGITFSGDTDTGVARPSANTVAFVTGGVEALRVSSSQNLFIGSANQITGVGVARVSLQGASAGQGTLGHLRATADTGGVLWEMAKSRGTAVDTYTIVSAGDTLGTLRFRGADGSTTVQSASIAAVVEGTPAAGDVRAGLTFNVGSGAGALSAALQLATDFSVNLPDAASVLKVNGTQVLAARRTGWSAATGTATRTSFATSTVTLQQLAERVKALIDDQIAHGLIGA